MRPLISYRNGGVMSGYRKTLGKRSAQLIARLYDMGKVIFTIQDVAAITGLDYFSAGRLISELKKRHIISTLKKGKHIIIPQELGSAETYLGNWFVVAREIVNSKEYYIGYYSAMRYWGMTTQPTVKVFVLTPKRQSPPKTLSDRVSFVYVNKKHMWGIREVWVTGTEKVNMSDIEKTIIDTLMHPEYSGGITEIAKGIWLVKDRIDLDKVLNYVKRLNKNVVAKRLGYILEMLELADAGTIKTLRQYIKNRYDLFDPTLERRSIGKNRWRLIDNVGRDRIHKIISM